MLSNITPAEKIPSVVRLNLGVSLLALAFHGVMAVFRGLFLLWTALTPARDKNENLSRARV